MSVLKGKNIGVTRTEQQSKQLAELIRLQGGHPVFCPLLNIQPLHFPPWKLERLLADLEQADWVVFTSINSVKYLLALNIDRQKLSMKKIAVVGKKTAQYLEKNGFKVHLYPDRYTAHDLAELLISEYSPGMLVFLPEGNLARPDLKQRLRQKGMNIKNWTVYETTADLTGQQALITALKKNALDFVTFFSPSAVTFFDECVKMDIGTKKRCYPVIACIGSVTSEKAASLGYQEVIVPEEYTSEALLEAIGRYIKEENAT